MYGRYLGVKDRYCCSRHRVSDLDRSTELHCERLAQKSAGKTADFAEGVGAFLAKRPAIFMGK